VVDDEIECGSLSKKICEKADKDISLAFLSNIKRTKRLSLRFSVMGVKSLKKLKRILFGKKKASGKVRFDFLVLVQCLRFRTGVNLYYNLISISNQTHNTHGK